MLTLAIISLLSAFIYFNNIINRDFSARRFQPPIELYASSYNVKVGQLVSIQFLTSLLSHNNYKEKLLGDPLYEGDFSVWPYGACQSSFQFELDPKVHECLVWSAFTESKPDYNSGNNEIKVIAVTKNNKVVGVYSGQPINAVNEILLPPKQIAQFLDDRPVFQKIVALGEVNTSCLNALLAIEDARFLDHKGVSFKAIFRAFLKNVKEMRFAEGGSTLTQQLVKNYFLTNEKTLYRKIIEMFMSFLLEMKIDKDEILETYINVIYLGQQDVFQVRGYGAASEYYFKKDISRLNLAQCSLLAAIVKSPGLYNPFRYPERALKRRNLVLEQMTKLKLISDQEMKEAQKESLPKISEKDVNVVAPYFVEAVLWQLKQVLKVDMNQGLKITTTLDIEAQKRAENAVLKTMSNLDKKTNHPLQVAFLSADQRFGKVRSLIGGRDFKVSQFNRAIQSYRQVGSIMKPIVYLSALETVKNDGTVYTPLTLLEDKPFDYSYEGQTWSPKNFNQKYYGTVPMYFALKNSLNCATASLGLEIGLDNIVDLSRRLGVKSKIESLPSLTLGAFELSPFEVLQVYSTIANQGYLVPLTFIDKIENLDGKILYKKQQNLSLVVAPETVAVLIGMMKHTLISGTASWMKRADLECPCAGKTGTTSDNKDAWFAGFSSDHVAVVWIGFDDNSSHGLTGASGASPLWFHYMNDYSRHHVLRDFQWPEGTRLIKRSTESFNNLKIPQEDIELIDRISF